MAGHLDTLMLPFERGLIDPPGKSRSWLFLNAQVLPGLDEDIKSALVVEQGFRGNYLDLQRAGYKVEPSIESDALFDGAMVIASRSRKLNEINFSRAWNATRSGGVLLFCGPKTSGVQPLRKWASKKAEIAGSLSKHHAIVFWTIKQDDEWRVGDGFEEQGGYRFGPGMFSATGPDKGSMLLVDSFDDRINGCAADFGAGWGYLSAELLKRSKSITQLELFEAEWKSLQAAKLNVQEAAAFHWCDLTREPPKGPFDWIIMNPPFHTGRASEPVLGIQFIEAAAKALPAGGRLLMVANANLPYEKKLGDRFRKVERLVQTGGFKIIEAVR